SCSSSRCPSRPPSSRSGPSGPTATGCSWPSTSSSSSRPSGWSPRPRPPGRGRATCPRTPTRPTARPSRRPTSRHDPHVRTLRAGPPSRGPARALRRPLPAHLRPGAARRGRPLHDGRARRGARGAQPGELLHGGAPARHVRPFPRLAPPHGDGALTAGPPLVLLGLASRRRVLLVGGKGGV